MNHIFNKIALAVKYLRLQLNLDQQSVASEVGVSLRTIQNIEAGKPVNSSSLFAYLDFLGLLNEMITTLPNPSDLTPMEQLKTTPKRRKRASKKVQIDNKKATLSQDNSINEVTGDFIWGDEK